MRKEKMLFPATPRQWQWQRNLFLEHVVGVDAADISHCHGNLAGAPPAGTHLPSPVSVVNGTVWHGGRVPDVPATTTDLANSPTNRGALGLAALAQGSNDLIAELDDLQGVALLGEEETVAHVEDVADGHLGNLGQVQVAQGAGSGVLLGPGEEGVDVLHGQLCGAQAQFFQVLGEREQERDVGRGDASTAQVQRTEGGGQLGEQSRDVVFLQETETCSIGEQVQVHQGITDSRVGGQELDQRRWVQTSATGQTQVGDTGGFGDREQSRVVDLSVGQVQVCQVHKAREEKVEHGCRDSAAFVERESLDVWQAHGQSRTPTKGLLEDTRERVSRATAQVNCLQDRQSHKQLPDNIHAQIALEMLLQQTLLQVRQNIQALQQGAGSQVLDLCVHLLGATQSNGGKVGEVQSAHQCAQGGVLGHVVEGLREDAGVRESHVSVENAQGSSVQGTGCKKARNEIDVAGSVSIRRDVQSQVRDDVV